MKIAFSSDEKLLAATGRDNRLLVWDVLAAEQLRRLDRHNGKQKPRFEWQAPGAITSIAFAPDGNHLTIGNANGTVYVVRLPPAPNPIWE